MQKLPTHYLKGGREFNENEIFYMLLENCHDLLLISDTKDKFKKKEV